MNVALLRSYAEQGMTRKEIAAVMGIPFSTVSNNCVKHKIKTKRPDTTGLRPLSDNSKRIIELRKQGLGYRMIAKQIGISRDAVLSCCHRYGLSGQQVEQRLTEEQAKSYISESGFDYVSGYKSNRDTVTVKCRQCGRTFERLFHIFRDVVNGTWNASNECPYCRADRLKAERDKRKEEKKNKAEREAQKRAQQKAERMSRAVNNEFTKRLAIHVCKNCGQEFCQMVTGYNSSTYCSEKCQVRWFNRNAFNKRRKKLKERPHDNDISLELLYKRDKGICYLCGCVCDWSDITEKNGTRIAGEHYPSVDHVFPVAKGGTHTWDNIKLACRKCNSIKRDRIQSPSVPN